MARTKNKVVYSNKKLLFKLKPTLLSSLSSELEEIFKRHLERAEQRVDKLIRNVIYEATECKALPKLSRGKNASLFFNAIYKATEALPKLSRKKIVFRRYGSLEPNKI